MANKNLYFFTNRPILNPAGRNDKLDISDHAHNTEGLRFGQAVTAKNDEK